MAGAYGRVLAIPAARRALVLGALIRVPLFAASVLLTFHVVDTLDRSYAEAGLVATVATICIAVSGPWRGRLLDRLGVRRVVLPSVVVNAVCWSIAPFSDYVPLLVLAAVAGLFVVPTFSVIRQAVIAAVPDEDRRTALSLDSVAVEISFMIGPVLGIWAATVWPTSWVLFGIEMCGVAAGIGLFLVNPPIRATELASPADRPTRRDWFSRQVAVLCLSAGTTTLVLSGCDISFIAALRHFDEEALIGPVLAIWGAGSVVGGLVYGALHRAIPTYVLLGGLAAVTVPIAFANDVWQLAVLAFVAGLLCAPTITASIDEISRLVPEGSLGEAMGWNGSAMTVGAALGAPLAGMAIDLWGFSGGFALAGITGLVIAVAVAVIGSRQRTTSVLDGVLRDAERV